MWIVLSILEGRFVPFLCLLHVTWSILWILLTWLLQWSADVSFIFYQQIKRPSLESFLIIGRVSSEAVLESLLSQKKSLLSWINFWVQKILLKGRLCIMHIALWLLQLQKTLTLWKQVYFQFYWMSQNELTYWKQLSGDVKCEILLKLSLVGGCIDSLATCPWSFIIAEPESGRWQFFCNKPHLHF